MTKRITKVIAALGVVAGLGVAALPLSSYAAETDVFVAVGIDTTTGTIEPDCKSGGVVASGAAGDIIQGECDINGSSNTGISIAIRDRNEDSLNQLGLTGDQSPTPSIIPAIGASLNLTDTQFAPTGLGLNGLPSGGGWGYKFTVGSSTNLAIAGNHNLWNGITLSDVIVAQSPSATAAVTMNGAGFSFRAVTAPTQTPGTYGNWVTITIDTLP